MPKNDIISLFDYSFRDGAVRGRQGRLSEKTGRRGKGKVTIEIESKPLVHDFSNRVLGRAPCEAIQDAIVRGIEAIAETVSSATRRKRDQMLKHPSEYKGRFDGGRIGPTPPRSGEYRKFNFSGRLKHLTVRENRTDESWTVNVPANRLNPKDFTAGAFRHMVRELQRLVPVIGNPKKLLADPKVSKAIDDSINDVVLNDLLRSIATNKDRRKALRDARKQAGLAAFGLVKAVF